MIVLLSDFGNNEYIGILKGVIHTINPSTKIIDLIHTISSQNIIEGSWVLKNSYSYFPKKTIFVSVVDPGVGTERKALLIKTKNYTFIGPDNGLLYETILNEKIEEIISINVSETVSNTFHARDIFAKTAAKVEMGIPIHTLGDKLQNLNEIVSLKLFQKGNQGIITRIDEFGNIITNIPSKNKDKYSVLIENSEYTLKEYKSYEESQGSNPFLIQSSCNTLEIAVKNASAYKALKTHNIKPGTKITIQ